jgi:hypothetical protein
MKKIKVYVNIPSKSVAGGVESLYQLVDAINNAGGESIILWDMKWCDTEDDNLVPERYQHYNIKYSSSVDDISENWIVYPEIWTWKIGTYKNLRQAIWWLSVDNYLYHCPDPSTIQNLSRLNITHFYQSFYALNFLQNNKIEKYLPLFDYINPKYTDESYNIEQKKDIVCYNPAKGIEILNQIISLNTDIQFIPIVNMDENQIINLLKLSKVYIDLGNHPGRDRIPREAVILGNCIITNIKGSAGFYNDIPISKEYKISNAEDAGDLIKECFKNFESILNDYYLYRSSVRNQKDQLYNLVKQYFIQES